MHVTQPTKDKRIMLTISAPTQRLRAPKQRRCVFQDRRTKRCRTRSQQRHAALHGG